MDSAGGSSATEANSGKSLSTAGRTGCAEPPPFHFAFSTHDVPQEDKFEIWRDLWMSQLGVDADILSAPPDFHAMVDMWQAGPLSLARVNSWNTIYRRTGTLARNGSDDFSFTLCQRNMVVGLNQSEYLGVEAGAGFFLSLDRQFTVQPSAGCHSSLLRMDRNALLELMPRDFQAGLQAIAPGNKLLNLISDLLGLVTSKTEPVTQQKRETHGRHIIDLVALLLNPSRDGRALIEGRGLKAARQGAVLQAIDQHFARPGLSAEAIGRSLGMSGRQVHRMLEDTTKTFYEHLLERRLLHAHELLSNSETTHLKVVEVAYRAGFKTAAHFNHAFRIRFGETPTAVRGQAGTEHTLRILRGSLVGEG
ncbi:MAG: helix-turn-helix domain-containing protein [Methyloceanibacter sp.]|uniref:helix-turn-helix domain-containing protein n=1 Tax=Methyloceanibacter sp. TaxID=1965321 RepID=UPI003D6D4AEF